MNFAQFRRIAVVAAASLGLAACGINSVPTKEETAKARWGDVEAAFQARANLVGNLAEVATSASDREGAILRDVTQARAQATSVQVDAGDLDDPEAIAAFRDAQNELGQGLGRLLASFEAYPQIQSNQNFLMLQGQLEGIENKIRVSISDYNEAVRDYNTEIRTFPSSIGANVIHGAEPLVPYEATTPGAENAPQLDLSPGANTAPAAGANDNTANQAPAAATGN